GCTLSDRGQASVIVLPAERLRAANDLQAAPLMLTVSIRIGDPTGELIVRSRENKRSASEINRAAAGKASNDGIVFNALKTPIVVSASTLGNIKIAIGDDTGGLRDTA